MTGDGIGAVQPLRQMEAGRAHVLIATDRRLLGKLAATEVARAIRECLDANGAANVVFASAPSQQEFLEELGAMPGQQWSRVTVFHLDEYVGLPSDAPQAFGQFLRDRLFNRVRPAAAYYLDGNAADLGLECARYAELLRTHPLDVACIGIGENGHLAFNDPPVADFADPWWVKPVVLDRSSREQQVHDGCFSALAAVPARALTLTLPAILAARSVHCIVPGPTKTQAVRDALLGPVTTACPASILQTHSCATIYLDPASAALLATDAAVTPAPAAWREGSICASRSG